MMRSDHMTVESKMSEFLLQILSKGNTLIRAPMPGQGVLCEADYPLAVCPA